MNRRFRTLALFLLVGLVGCVDDKLVPEETDGGDVEDGDKSVFTHRNCLCLPSWRFKLSSTA